MAELLKANKKYIFELIGTFLLVFLGTGTIVLNDMLQGDIGHAGIVFTFGFLVAFIVYLFGPITGASMNPARSLGPAIASGSLDSLWIYLTAPILGASIAGFVYKLFYEKGCYHAQPDVK